MWIPHALLLALAAPAPVQGSLNGYDGLTAYRPQHAPAVFPLRRTAVPEALEEDPELGPGIRVNGSQEVDPVAEDDLIEVTVRPNARLGALFLERSDRALVLWTTRTREEGTDLSFAEGASGPLEFPAGEAITLWAECTTPGEAPLGLTLASAEGRRLDRLVFHRFRAIVIALGGEGQGPGWPGNPGFGTFRLANQLFEDGYDAFAFDEDDVLPDGSGPVFGEIVNAVRNRKVGQVAILGYSHGAGSTHDLCARLDTMALSIGGFRVAFTAYVDGVENSSDDDLDPEMRRPIGSALHLNHFQVGSLYEDLLVDGGPVPGSLPGTTGLNVEDTPWGVTATHFTVDDLPQVRTFVRQSLAQAMAR